VDTAAPLSVSSVSKGCVKTTRSNDRDGHSATAYDKPFIVQPTA
jgi:hypothetical protein